MKLAFRDKAGRDHMTKSDGQEDSFNKMEYLLRSLLIMTREGARFRRWLYLPAWR